VVRPAARDRNTVVFTDVMDLVRRVILRWIADEPQLG